MPPGPRSPFALARMPPVSCIAAHLGGSAVGDASQVERTSDHALPATLGSTTSTQRSLNQRDCASVDLAGHRGRGGAHPRRGPE
jgi:hypothetical protein